MDKRKKVPRICGGYRNIYKPQPAVYRGPDTESFRSGEQYTEWIPNDFTFIKDKDGVWHSFGITHPRPDCFQDDFNCSGNGHEAEFQLFHATYEGELSELLESGQMTDCEKVLYPSDRTESEPLECWAPCIFEREGKYFMYYSPGCIRYAVSEDLYHWTAMGVAFEGPPHMRDPYIIYENGIYTMVYVSDHLYYRTSDDLVHWSEEKLFQKNAYPGSAQESPCVIKRDGMYYLLWCICDGSNGWYDNRTFVFVSDTLYGFDQKTPVAILQGIAPELIADQGNDFIVSAFYPENGLNMAKIEWNEI